VGPVSLARPGAACAPAVQAVPLLPPEVQARWGVPHATWFTLMGIGGGLFLVARLLGRAMRLGFWLGLPVVDLVSFGVIAIGGLVLVADLGRPWRFLRAVLRPGTSWISRGAIADFIFLVAGGLLVLPDLAIGGRQPFAALPWDAAGGGPLGPAVETVALLAAAVVIFYAGQVLADHSAIPYWRSAAIPLQFVLSSLAISLAATMALAAPAGTPIEAVECWLLLATLVALLATLAWHAGTDRARPGKRESLDGLLRGRYRRAFLGGVVGAGTLAPAGLALAAALGPALRPGAGLAALALTLAGGFLLRLLTLRVGIVPPVRAVLPGRPR
jgi:formate-dependent nitrite reductase membrane component NrfD